MRKSESRFYLCTSCGEETEISGPEFLALADPLANMKQTYCVECEEYLPLDQFKWSDTGESIPDYYKRHGAKATNIDRFWCDTSGLLCLGILGLFVGGMLGAVVGMTSGFWFGAIASIVLGLAGGIAGLVIRETVISPRILERVCGTRDVTSLQ